jgi:hypothetical protein
MYSPNQAKEKVIFDGSFSNGDFSNWNVANDATNQWVVGSDITYQDRYAAYISNDGNNNIYDNGVNQVSHIYFDVRFPRQLSSADLEFDYRGLGIPESANMRVSLVNPNIVPVAGEMLDNEYSIGTEAHSREIATTSGILFFKKTTYSEVFEYHSTLSWKKEYIPLNLSDLRNRKKRIVFSWVNKQHDSVFNPPIAIDNVRVTTVIPVKNH